MQRTLSISFAIALSSAALAAQAVDQYRPQKWSTQPSVVETHVFTNPPLSSCPVSMSARQSGSTSLVAVTPGQSPARDFAQQIHLTLGDRSAAKIVAATVTVHGLNARSRFLPAGNAGDGPSRITRTLDVSLSSEDQSRSAADLMLRGFTSVRFIDIDSLTYADGSTWRPGESVCRVAPDLVMLVDAR